MIHAFVHDLIGSKHRLRLCILGSHGIRWPCLLNLPYVIIPFYYGAKLLFQGRPEEEIKVHIFFFTFFLETNLKQNITSKAKKKEKKRECERITCLFFFVGGDRKGKKMGKYLAYQGRQCLYY